MSLVKHGCTRQLDGLMEPYNHGVVILVRIDPGYLNIILNGALMSILINLSSELTSSLLVGYKFVIHRFASTIL